MTHPQELSATTPRERETLKALAFGRLTAVDVGTFRGGTAHCLLEAMPKGHVYTIDTFDGRSGGPVVAGWPKHELIRDCITNLEAFNSRYTLIIGESCSVASIFEDDSVNLVFIDASHDYESCLADIEAWYPKVKSNGGIICGHDYDVATRYVPEICIKEHSHLDCCDEHNCHPGVIRAVDSFFTEVNHKDSVWWKHV